ncbi:LysR substrate-binding domain-containing protein [Mesorhizobium sp.]|uniref:LysR substrate-binding domain-containing protein n=1 Tax=Mesorhizobium sp. TaxID=1871066 RepID=UPI000FE5BF0A|nr:LysR substrate-binding domain-containing protein [Mesorhizobium sp.]RWB69989.1 MAG: LysR family transcriptional regulator [Mesorhizobium sp.]
MNLTLRQISYFALTAETGSVSGAATAARISQSAVTESIRALEAQIGVALFVRHTRGVALTHEGHQFLRHVKLILATVDDATKAFANRDMSVSGKLNLGVTSLVAGYFLADILARFRRVFPDIEVKVYEEDRRYIEHLLINGELDLALMLTSNLEDDTALARETLVRSRYRLWLSAKHPLVDKSLVQPEDLRGQDLIALDIDELLEAITSWLHAEALDDRIVFKTTSVEAVRSMIGTGAGVAILPDMALRPYTLEGDRLEARPINNLSLTLDVGLVWRRGSSSSAQADIFRTLVTDFKTSRW